MQAASLELSRSPRQQVGQFGAKPMPTIDLLSVVTNPEAKQPDQDLVDLLAFKSGNLRVLSGLGAGFNDLDPTGGSDFVCHCSVGE